MPRRRLARRRDAAGDLVRADACVQRRVRRVEHAAHVERRRDRAPRSCGCSARSTPSRGAPTGSARAAADAKSPKPRRRQPVRRRRRRSPSGASRRASRARACRARAARRARRRRRPSRTRSRRVARRAGFVGATCVPAQREADDVDAEVSAASSRAPSSVPGPYIEPRVVLDAELRAPIDALRRHGRDEREQRERCDDAAPTPRRIGADRSGDRVNAASALQRLELDTCSPPPNSTARTTCGRPFSETSSPTLGRPSSVRRPVATSSPSSYAR